MGLDAKGATFVGVVYRDEVSGDGVWGAKVQNDPRSIFGILCAVVVACTIARVIVGVVVAAEVVVCCTQWIRGFPIFQVP